MSTGPERSHDSLTDREREILACLVEGLSNHEIASHLHLAHRTVKWYNSQIYSKLGVSSRKDAVEQAMLLDLLDSASDVSQSSVRHNLPTQTTPFIGRQQELADITDLLIDPNLRLLTILAPGGMGKTRLAMAVAERQFRYVADGVFFVPLAPLSSPDDIVMAIAGCVGFSFYGGDPPKQQLLDYFHERNMLLVLDNFEHLLDGAPLVSDILQVAPQVKVLATSREKLNLSGETVYTLSGLHFPDWETPADALEFDAIKLFMQSAERVRSGLHLDTDDLKYLAQICYLTEGMPLALLLAATWVHVLSLGEIAAEIQASVDFLAVELRDVPRRQWSIRAVFEPTWKRLAQDQQDAYQKLSVFRGGFTRHAAEVVAGSNIRTILTLANKSLLRLEPGGRYQIHELLRQYAETRLQADIKNVATVYDLHCTYFSTFVHERQPQIYGGDQREAAVEIETEFENIRVMWDWAAKHTRIDAIQKSLHTLVAFYHQQSRFLEAVESLERATNSLETEDGPVGPSRFVLAEILGHLGHFYLRLGLFEKSRTALERSQAIYTKIDRSPTPGVAILPESVLGLLASVQGDYETAIRLIEESLIQAEAAEDGMTVCALLYFLTGVYFARGEYEAARHLGQRAYALAQAQDNRWFSAYILNELGNISRALGDHDDGKQHFQASYTIREEFADPAGMALALNHLGRILILEGDFAEAQKLYQQNVTIYRDIGDRGGLAAALDGLGKVNLALGDFAGAERHFHEALHIAGTQIIHITFSTLVGLGDLLLQTGQPVRGVELLALSLHHPAGNHEIKAEAEDILNGHKAEIPQDVFAAAVERGKTLDLGTVVNQLLA